MGWKKRFATITSAVMAVPMAIGLAAVTGAAAPEATAAPLTSPVHRSPAGGFQEVLVPSSMGPIKVQVQWARRGGNAALYLLDGLRARNDYNAWSHDTNAMAQFVNDNITLVMPVGGQSSWYTDWMGPSNLNGQKFTYKWETFLTKELPDFLAGSGVSRYNNGIVGLSMAGSSALSLAAHHRDQFKFGASLSGALNISAPGMREAMRLAMLDAGRYNIDSMWGPPWAPGFSRNDPFVFASQLKGLSMFISAGDGIPGPMDRTAPGLFNTMNAMGLEFICDLNTRAFQSKLALLHIPATFDYTWSGTHNWGLWESELWRARPQILDALNAH